MRRSFVAALVENPASTFDEIDHVYGIRSAIGEGDAVVIELTWRGTMAKDLEPFAAGTPLRAEHAIVLRFSHGKIISQTDYPCYHPIAS